MEFSNFMAGLDVKSCGDVVLGKGVDKEISDDWLPTVKPLMGAEFSVCKSTD